MLFDDDDWYKRNTHYYYWRVCPDIIDDNVYYYYYSFIDDDIIRINETPENDDVFLIFWPLRSIIIDPDIMMCPSNGNDDKY